LSCLLRPLPRPPPRPTLFPYTTLFRSCARYLDEDQLMRLLPHLASEPADLLRLVSAAVYATPRVWKACLDLVPTGAMEDAISRQDRKSTRLNSSHVKISYAVFCLKKKK